MLLLGAVLGLAGCSEGGGGTLRPPATQEVPAGDQATTTTACLEQAEGGGCRRLPFAGDRNATAQAGAMALRARQALSPFAQRTRQPTSAEVERALTTALPDGDVQVADSATGPRGTAFGVTIPGGCLYGSVAPNQLTVEVGGAVTTGGCL